MMTHWSGSASRGAFRFNLYGNLLARTRRSKALSGMSVRQYLAHD